MALFSLALPNINTKETLSTGTPCHGNFFSSYNSNERLMLLTNFHIKINYSAVWSSHFIMCYLFCILFMFTKTEVENSNMMEVNLQLMTLMLLQKICAKMQKFIEWYEQADHANYTDSMILRKKRNLAMNKSEAPKQ